MGFWDGVEVIDIREKPDENGHRGVYCDSCNRSLGENSEATDECYWLYELQRVECKACFDRYYKGVKHKKYSKSDSFKEEPWY